MHLYTLLYDLRNRSKPPLKHDAVQTSCASLLQYNYQIYHITTNIVLLTSTFFLHAVKAVCAALSVVPLLRDNLLIHNDHIHDRAFFLPKTLSCPRFPNLTNFIFFMKSYPPVYLSLIPCTKSYLSIFIFSGNSYLFLR